MPCSFFKFCFHLTCRKRPCGRRRCCNISLKCLRTTSIRFIYGKDEQERRGALALQYLQVLCLGLFFSPTVVRRRGSSAGLDNIFDCGLHNSPAQTQGTPNTERRAGADPAAWGVNLCSVCGQLAKSVCSKCKKMRYCGREHQTEHWKSGGHKEVR